MERHVSQTCWAVPASCCVEAQPLAVTAIAAQSIVRLSLGLLPGDFRFRIDLFSYGFDANTFSRFALLNEGTPL